MKDKKLTESQVRGIFRAYDDGVTLEAISQLFKVSQHSIINMVHAYFCGQRRNINERFIHNKN